MSNSFDSRLNEAKDVLNQVDTVLGNYPGKLPADVTSKIQELVNYRSDIDHLLGLIEARAAARNLMDALETTADEADCVPFGSARVKFQHVRLIGLLGYLSANWALSDRITGFVGRILCTPEAGNNLASPPQLVSHFINKERNKKSAAVIYDSIRRLFGWPIGISYAIRNHFIHDGAQASGEDLFEGPTATAAFRISTAGWEKVEGRAKSYGVEQTLLRSGACWPSSPRNDLRILLDFCEREMDDALGVLLGSSCRSLLAHVAFMVGDD